MRAKPKVGDALVLWTRAKRYGSNERFEEVTVSRVGTKFFYVSENGREIRSAYDLLDWMVRDTGNNERTNFPSQICESMEEVETIKAEERDRSEFQAWRREYKTPSIGKIRRIMAIVREDEPE